MNKIDLIEFSQYDQQSQINYLVRKINEVIQNMPFVPKFSDGKSYDKMNRGYIVNECKTEGGDSIKYAEPVND